LRKEQKNKEVTYSIGPEGDRVVDGVSHALHHPVVHVLGVVHLDVPGELVEGEVQVFRTREVSHLNTTKRRRRCTCQFKCVIHSIEKMVVLQRSTRMLRLSGAIHSLTWSARASGE
jgi:hypothetical protein